MFTLIAAALAVAPATAFAGTYVENACIEGYPWEQAEITSYFELENNCPDQMDLSLQVPTSPGQHYGHYVYGVSDGKPIESVRVKMWGSNGTSNLTRQGFLVCAAVCDFSRIVTVSGPNGVGSGDFELTVENGGLPVGARRVMIVGDCMGPGICQPGAALHFSDIEITYRDDNPPVVSLVVPQGWQKENVPVSYSAEDPGAGIASARLSIDGIEEPLLECGIAEFPDFWDFCPPLNASSLDILASDLPNGAYTLRFVVTDYAGERSEVTRTFKVDSTSPPAPDDVVVTPGRNGWVNRGVVDLDWPYSESQDESTTESGVAGTYYDIEGPDFSSDPPPRYIAGATNSIGVRLTGYSTVNLSIWTVDAASNESERTPLTLNLDTYVPNPPLVDSIAPFNRTDLAGGRGVSWSNYNAGPSGICGAKLAFSRLASFNPGEDPDDLSAEGDLDSYDLAPSELEALPQGDVSLHIRSFSCAGLAGAIAHVPVLIDFGAPTVSAHAGPEWLSETDIFRLRAVDPVQGGGNSGIASLEYSVDGAAAVFSDAEQQSLQLGPGRHTVTATATDRAGNFSEPSTFAVNVDASAPTGAFEQRDAQDPRSIAAVVEDSDSGISEARLEYRDQTGVWRRIGETRGGAQSFRIAAQLPEGLPAGEYPLALVAYDKAGHATTITSFADGSTARFTAPLRKSANLKLSVSASTGKKRWTTLAFGRWGEGFLARGTLKSADGSALSGRSIEVAATPEQGIEGEPITTTTLADGSWRVNLKSGQNRTIRARFLGDATVAPTSAVARVLTAARLTLLPRRQQIRSGETLNLRGRVSGTPFAQPENGKRIVLQWRAGGRYGSVRKTLHASDDGRFVYRFRYINRGSKAVTFRIRAVAPAEQFWPFERGQSDSIDVTVTP
ncbi:MAG: Ig-like domain repeat protein [Solirubrobacterales bacterium]|nr:Ig-like domain repeat protein [Solirubrobacterales bacterium]